MSDWLREGSLRANGATYLLVGALAACCALGCDSGSSSSDDGSSGNAAAGASAGRPSATAGGGNANVAGGGADSAGEGPSEDRPPRPEWDSPLTLGDAGWQQSKEPLCESFRGHMQTFGVWADEQGVSALYVSDCNPLSDGFCEGVSGGSLQFNDGTGWRPQLSNLSGALRINGLPGAGPVLTGTIDGETGFYLVEAGQTKLGYPIAESTWASFFGVGPQLGYARNDREVVRYRDGKWSRIATLDATVRDLWANSDLAVVVGLDQMFMVKTETDSTFSQLPDVPVGQYTAVWGFGDEDLWAGNSVGQLVHYDGKAWQVVETGSQDTTGSGISALWGDAGVLYFTTSSEFGRLDENGVDLIYRRDPKATTRFALGALWGKSKTEVFLTLQDVRFDDYACGSSFIVWFDGTTFHQF